MKSLDSTQVKRKWGRPPKPKAENFNFQKNLTTAANHHTTWPWEATKILGNDIFSGELVHKNNVEHERADRWTVTKFNNVANPRNMTINPNCWQKNTHFCP